MSLLYRRLGEKKTKQKNKNSELRCRNCTTPPQCRPPPPQAADKNFYNDRFNEDTVTYNEKMFSDLKVNKP